MSGSCRWRILLLLLRLLLLTLALRRARNERVFARLAAFTRVLLVRVDGRTLRSEDAQATLAMQRRFCVILLDDFRARAANHYRCHAASMTALWGGTRRTVAGRIQQPSETLFLLSCMGSDFGPTFPALPRHRCRGCKPPQGHPSVIPPSGPTPFLRLLLTSFRWPSPERAFETPWAGTACTPFSSHATTPTLSLTRSYPDPLGQRVSFQVAGLGFEPRPARFKAGKPSVSLSRKGDASPLASHPGFAVSPYALIGAAVATNPEVRPALRVAGLSLVRVRQVAGEGFEPSTSRVRAERSAN